MAESNIAGSDFSLSEGMGIGIVKQVSETLLLPIIGDKTVMSGGIKLILALGASKIVPSNKILGFNMRKTIANALVIDAVEDLSIVALQALSGTPLNFGGVLGGGNQAQASAQDAQVFV